MGRSSEIEGPQKLVCGDSEVAVCFIDYRQMDKGGAGERKGMGKVCTFIPINNIYFLRRQDGN